MFLLIKVSFNNVRVEAWLTTLVQAVPLLITIVLPIAMHFLRMQQEGMRMKRTSIMMLQMDRIMEMFYKLKPSIFLVMMDLTMMGGQLEYLKELFYGMLYLDDGKMGFTTLKMAMYLCRGRCMTNCFNSSNAIVDYNCTSNGNVFLRNAM